MQKVLTAAQMREVDRLTTERYGIPSIILMENAAHAVARVITEKLGGSVKGKSILILCGKGNNGGDGAALARILASNGAFVSVDLFASISETLGDARSNFERLGELKKTGGSTLNFREISPSDIDGYFFENWPTLSHCLDESDVVVDALFGTGLTRPIDGVYAELVETLKNQKNTRSKLRFISIDIPSGLAADIGEQIGENFAAHVTITFTAPKAGNVIAPAAAFNGELIVADIGSPQELIDEQPSQLYLAEKDDAADWLEKTAFSSSDYKNKRGHALIVAGSQDYSGAVVLAGDAAMRSGVGLVTLVTPRSSKDSVVSRVLPEVMVRGVAETESGAISEAAFDEVDDLIEKADSVAIGCGLSQSESTGKFVEKVLAERSQPVIVDADALNLLSPYSGGNATVKERADDVDGTLVDTRVSALILTPHEGEFLRLLGKAKNHPDGETPSPLLRKEGSFGEDRVASVREFATKHNVILVLKGERVLIGAPDGRVVVNPTGKSGLGKAGNGDTLTGILAGFMAQAVKMNIDIFETVVAAVYIAGMAGDVAEKKYGKRVMTASDVRECLTDVFASFEENR